MTTQSLLCIFFKEEGKQIQEQILKLSVAKILINAPVPRHL